MSRSFGGTLFTTRSPMAISPPVMFSSPAIMRRSVDFPQPDGRRGHELAIPDADIHAMDDLGRSVSLVHAAHVH